MSVGMVFVAEPRHLHEYLETMLVLDIAGSDAERLHEHMGWVRVGAIPDDGLVPRGSLSGTTPFYRAV